MGVCASSRVAAVSDSATSNRLTDNGTSTHIMSDVPSSGGLQILLLQEYLRRSFRDFISLSWTPSLCEDEINKYIQISPRTLGLNCVDFWTDVQDYISIRSGHFQFYRASHIYEKYIMHGASHAIPIPTTVIDECTDIISTHSRKCDSTVFASAEAEILDFLIAEVYPKFEREALQEAHRSNNDYSISYLAAGAKSIYRRRNSYFKSPDKDVLTKIMHKILADSAYLAAFKAYMIKQECENLLYAYNELVEIYEKLDCLFITSKADGGNIEDHHDTSMKKLAQTTSGDSFNQWVSNGRSGSESARNARGSQLVVADQANNKNLPPTLTTTMMEFNDIECAEMQIFFYHINDFYDTYLSLGSPFRLKLDDTIYNSFTDRLYNCKAVDKSIFEPIQDAIFSSLVCEHLNTFLNTSDYKQLVGSGRGSIVAFRGDLKTESNLADSLRRESIQEAMVLHLKRQQEKDKQKEEKGEKETLFQVASRDEESKEASLGAAYDSHNHQSAISILDVNEEHHLKAQSALSSMRDHTGSFGNSNPIVTKGIGKQKSQQDILTQVELKNFVHNDDSVKSFGHYMHKKGALSVLQFYLVTYAYQNSLNRNHFEQIAESTSIFDRYISRNSDDHIGIPDDIRSDIVCDLCRASPYLFKAASEWTFQKIHDVYWLPFKEEVYAKAKIDSVQRRATSTDASASSDSSDDDDDDDDEAMDSMNGPEVCNGGNIVALNRSFSSLALKYYPPEEKTIGNGTSTNEDDDKAAPFVSIENHSIEKTSDGDGTSGTKKAGSRRRSSISLVWSLIANEKTSIDASLPQSSSTSTNERKTSISLPKENCQEFRRRSLNREPDPARLLAATTGPNALSMSTSFSASELIAKSPKMNGFTGTKARRNSVNSIIVGGKLVDFTGSTEDTEKTQASLRINAPTRDLAIIKNNEKQQFLRNIIAHPNCCSIFKEFLERESASQTILFIIEAEEYRRITNTAYQQMNARKIYNKFLHPLSIRPVPVSEETSNYIKQNLDNGGPALFKQCQEDVLTYIEACQLPKLTKSTADITVIQKILSTASDTLNQKFSKQSMSSTVPGYRRTSVSFKTITMNETKLLRCILQNQLLTRFFKDFCNRIFVNESLFFWLDAEYYANIPGSDYMKRSAYNISKKYIYDDAKLSINISDVTRQEILTALPHARRDLFVKAQCEIYRLLEIDALPKFLRGPEYQAMMECIKASTKSTTGQSAYFGEGLFAKMSSFMQTRKLVL